MGPNKQDLSKVIPILKSLLWTDPETRAMIQQHGVDVTWSHFYSSIPSIAEIENSYEYTGKKPPYFDEKIFNDQLFRSYLLKLTEFSSEFDPPIEGDEENCQKYFWANSQFSYADAMSYYCFIRLVKPTTIIEIGSGFSTLVAIEAVEKNNSGQIHCIEPFPREFIKNNRSITLHQQKAQDFKPDFFNDTMKDGDILFIDSTHTVKTGSDCLHIYLRLIPNIRREIFIHVHDVFLPYGLPKEWLLNHQRFWTEQYLLLAFLTDNPKAALLYSSVYNSKNNSKLMNTLMRNRYPYGGGSVWFKYKGSQ